MERKTHGGRSATGAFRPFEDRWDALAFALFVVGGYVVLEALAWLARLLGYVFGGAS